MIPLIRPHITEDTKKRVCAVLDSGYLTEGAVTREFETVVADYLGVNHCLAVTSCTTGLEVALRCLDIGPGDEVIVPDYTYPATASAVAIVGATPVLVDVSPHTMLMDFDALEAALTPATKAIMPVSIFGNPLDYDRLGAFAQKHGLYIIEDAACALGAEYKGKKVGSFADISVFSCHPRKFVTTGEGGLVVTNNKKWADWMVSYKHFGMGKSDSRAKVGFERIGTNYKLSDVLAAIGLSQMTMVDELLSRRQDMAARYIQLLAGIEGIDLPGVVDSGTHSYQSFCVFVENRDKILAAMREKGIEVQIGTYSLRMHRAFAENDIIRINGSMPGSTYAFKHCLALPLYHEMTEDEQKTVVNSLQELVQ